MRRQQVQPREGWQALVEAQGLIWHGTPGEPYWDESACYVFESAEIAKIESAAEAVYGLLIEAGDRIVAHPALMARFGIPGYCHDAIRTAWASEPPALNYGRFDFGYSGSGEPKLFEFNCDTPTAMLEAAVVQWDWKEAIFPHLDQYNSLHERLIDRWAEIGPRLPNKRVWFAHAADDAHEDTITTTYMRDLAAQAGLETLGVLIDDIGVDADGRVVDGDDRLISAIFKLYPWEWIVEEEYGPAIVRHLRDTHWIEPIWKMFWSNKAILPLLWEMFPGHPNLLAASWDADGAGPSYVTKPVLAREGANIEIVAAGEVLAQNPGEYSGPKIYQQLYPLRDFGKGYPVLGAWIVDGVAAGMGIREDGLITGNLARFVPHVIEG
jgi:glutathionylspermidine synthase